ncbi:MAG: signal peptidase II [Clostridia bacterium]|nr:signal peptidase II [Clostridia bacterium]
MNKKLKFILIYSAVIVTGILLDQFTKILMEDILANGTKINVLGSWLTFHWTINYGASFGMMYGQNWLFFAITVAGLPFFGYMLWRARTRSLFSKLGFAFAISGTIGNAIDRAFLGTGFFNGGVRDFISVQGFAIFNVADSFLVVGVIMAVLGLVFFDYDAVTKPQIEDKNEENGNDN